MTKKFTPLSATFENGGVIRPTNSDLSELATVSDYAAVLATLQQVAPGAHIAGGAVRDTILHKQIHDIDVFMHDEYVARAAALLRSSCGYVKVGDWKQYLGFSDPAMTCVAKFEKADETIPICIIGLRANFVSPEDNMARFDFGVCMAAFDGDKTIRTAKFEQDVEEKTFTLCRADNGSQFAYSMSRFKKITAGRYSGWNLVIPDEFKEHAKEHAFRETYYVKGMDGEYVLRPKERTLAA
jgi:hypothetical protein